MLIFETICALATPPYKSALALIRLSGDLSLKIIQKMTKRKNLTPNMAVFTKLYSDEKKSEVLDECVITYFKGPHSYTGFDTVEITCHGSLVVVEEILNALVKNGARRAKPGEFSAQAFYNGKMDLLKAEGINDLIHSHSKRGKDLALKTLEGDNSKILISLKERLLNYIADVEYYIENFYLEDEDEELCNTIESISSNLKEDIENLEEELKKTKRANQEYRGFDVAIIGQPNAGKSTLLNALLKEDKAIVSSIPGTTRDVVSGVVEIRGVEFRFEDTAGIRESEDEIENLGIQRSFKAIEKADIVLFCSENGFEEDSKLSLALKDKRVIRVSTKADINDSKDGDVQICSLNGDVEKLISLIFRSLNIEEKEETLFLGKREEEYLEKILFQLKDAKEKLEETRAIDIFSDQLRAAIIAINDFLGRDTNSSMEDIYNTLFSKFCLGK